jgi:hypothetical protein
MTGRRSWKEDFARFFESPSREGLRELLRQHAGEADEYDFKESWPAYAKVAKHLLALANSGGGALILGIREQDDRTFEPVGLEALLDKAELQKGVARFVPHQLEYEVLDFAFSESEYPTLVGKRFQVVFVDYTPRYLPLISMAAGNGIERDTIYVRRGTSSERASYDELQSVLNRRIETGYSSRGELDLAKHLAELSALYEHVPRYRHMLSEVSLLGNLYEKNPRFPQEDFPGFVLRLIEKKKRIVESIVSRW